MKFVFFYLLLINILHVLPYFNNFNKLVLIDEICIFLFTVNKYITCTTLL